MNKARRITRRRGRGPFRRYVDHLKLLAVRGTSDSLAGSECDATEHLADNIISASHLQHRSVRSEAIEDYTVHSIHLSDESVTSSKVALESIQPCHLSFNPVQGVSGLNLFQQFGNVPFVFSEDQDVIYVTVPLQSPYEDEQYVLIATCNHPVFQAYVQSRRQQEAIIGITRTQGSFILKGWLSWIAIGGTSE
ncbi:WIAG-tail domain [Paenibacillus sp. GCM10028914]|uniref:WIAG-tail domain n=1 Tax=Paenibacillus sp. GCM10028914 TaxID=3273416 RepID=UPI003610B011